ncbi:MAG: hypothetical protein ACRC6M_18955 [Microcystaceae cyanobacterium]
MSYIDRQKGALEDDEDLRALMSRRDPNAIRYNFLSIEGTL